MEKTLLDPKKALEILEGIELFPKTETVPLDAALGRVLAESLPARMDSPPFTKAAMDGYALRGSDRADGFRVVETIAAGDVPGKTIGDGECSKIMTGAMVPDGADKIVRVEYTSEAGGMMRIEQPEPQENIIRRGENLAAGETLLRPRVLNPQDIGVLASQGYVEIPVGATPLVGIVTTGSELCAAGDTLSSGRIYDSNGPQLRAQVTAAGARIKSYGIVPDEPTSLSDAAGRALKECDVVILSGGVSMGDLDYVPGVLTDLGADILFHRLAIKPGKPTLFARAGNAFAFGLPGNPVSTFVIFEIFVKPFLYRWMGAETRPRIVSGTLTRGVKRSDLERAEYLPARVEGNEVTPLSYHGSSHLSALREADGLIRVDIGEAVIEKGTVVYVRLV